MFKALNRAINRGITVSYFFQESFHSLEKWLFALESYSDDTYIVIVANKCDLDFVVPAEVSSIWAALAPMVTLTNYTSLCVRKPTIWVSTWSDTNRTVVIEDGKRLEILDLESRGIVLYVYIAKVSSYCEADLRLCFRLCRLLVSPCGGSYMHFPPCYITRCSQNRVLVNGANKVFFVVVDGCFFRLCERSLYVQYSKLASKIPIFIDCHSECILL